MTCGNNLKIARKKIGYTQKEFGKIFGLKQWRISYYENDKKWIPFDLAIKMTGILKVPLKRIHDRKWTTEKPK